MQMLSLKAATSAMKGGSLSSPISIMPLFALGGATLRCSERLVR